MSIWKPVEALCDEYSVDEVQIEELAKVITKRKNLADSLHPCWLLVDDREELCLSPVAYEAIEAELKMMAAKPPVELADGAVIKLEHVKKTNKPSKDKHETKLEDLYAEFGF